MKRREQEERGILEREHYMKRCDREGKDRIEMDSGRVSKHWAAYWHMGGV